ncbi:MAG: response regulator [Planctomycetes bacterium]|nr:response regulator [Planctomycetota bacterium]
MSQGKVLVVEDDPDVLGILEGMVADLGHEPTLARNGREGLERLAVRPFDLVITDLWMPEVDGVQLVHEIMKTYPHLPVIVLSGSVPPNVRKDLEAHNCKAIVEKPLHFDSFATLIEKVLVTAQRSAAPSKPPGADGA